MHSRLVQTGRYLRTLARAFPGSLRDVLLASAKSVNFSNYGEDLVLTRMFQLPPQGFYVDIGSNHPIVASNTFRLDLMGWTGVAIEPNPALTAKYARLRPSCQVVTSGVGETAGRLEYILFNIDQCNTVDPKLADIARQRGIKEIGRIPIEVRPLDELLAEHVRDHFIDVMSIDIEGHEIPALRSNNWARWTPAIILGEDHLPFGRSFEDSELALFLRDRGYAVVSRVHFTTFFVHRDHAERLAW